MARRTAERHRRENLLMSNLRYALETSGTLLDAANYINSHECRMFWLNLEEFFEMCGNAKNVSAYRALFQEQQQQVDQPPPKKMIKMTEEEKRECDEATKQFLDEMKKSQAQASSTPIAQCATTTTKRKRKSTPERLLQRTIMELSNNHGGSRSLHKKVKMPPGVGSKAKARISKTWACLKH